MKQLALDLIIVADELEGLDATLEQFVVHPTSSTAIIRALMRVSYHIHRQP